MIHSKRTGHYRNIGLLILRVGLGIIFILHGYPKVSGGPETWSAIGSALSFMRLDPMFFGFMAGIIELVGGIFLVLGLFFRPSLILIIIIMIIARIRHIDGGAGLFNASNSIELFIVFFSLIFIGAGRYSLDNIFNKQRSIY